MPLRVAMNAPAVDGYGTNVVVVGGADNVTWYTTPALFWSGGKVAGGLSNTFGFGPLLVSGSFNTISPSFGLFNLAVSGAGRRGAPDRRRQPDVRDLSPRRQPPRPRVRHVAEIAGVRQGGAYRIDEIAHGFLFGGVPRTTTLSLTFDPSHAADASPPLFTSVALLDGAGNMTRFIDPNGSGASCVSASPAAT